jgi:hypothetical protein
VGGGIHGKLENNLPNYFHNKNKLLYTCYFNYKYAADNSNMHGNFSSKIMKSTRGVAADDGIAEAKAGLENTLVAAIHFGTTSPVWH